MKTITHKTPFLLTAIFLVTIIACDKPEQQIKDAAPFTIQKDNYTLVKNSALSHEAKNNRSETYSASFEIESVERINDLLLINILYQVGCTNSKFEIIWDGLIMESYPTQTR